MLCECGCGNETGVYARTFKSKGIVKGEPCRFLPGHAGGMAIRRDEVTADLWEVTDCGYGTPCWVWKGTRKNQWGHCSVWMGGREYSAHRTVYEMHRGAIPDGLELDHLCRNPPCVNPDHLDAVTHAVNLRRGRLAKLTQEEVDDIRASTIRSAAEMAQEYGVSTSTIYSIRRRTTWK